LNLEIVIAWTLSLEKLVVNALVIPSAKDLGLFGSTVNPVTPSSTISVRPPILLATTGTPK
jgi:hypothetical protein